MPNQLDQLFPEKASWPFYERASGATFLLELSSRAEAGRRTVELTAPREHQFQAFFDRMTITGAGLELNRIRLRSQTLDIRPPLLVTTDQQPNRVADLFPGLAGSFPMATPPYAGSVIAKHWKEIPKPGSPQPDVSWTVEIDAKGREGTRVLRATLEFSRSGLVSYIGQIYGVEFVYVRDDPALHPRPVAGHAEPPQHWPASRRSVQHPYDSYRDRITREVSEAPNDPALLEHLRKRSSGEPELKDLLEKRHLL